MKLTIDQWCALGKAQHARLRRGEHSYSSLARATGLSWSTVSRIAKRRHVPRRATAEKIRAASGNMISLEWLLGIDPE